MRGNLRRTILSVALVGLYGDKRSHSRYGYSIGFFSGKDLCHEYYINDYTQSNQLSAVYVRVLRKIVHTFSLIALSLDQYGINNLVRESTQLQSHPSGSQSVWAAAEGGRMGFAYSRCSRPYGCTKTTRCSTGGRHPLTGPPMLWGVLWQPGPLDQGRSMMY